VHRGPTRSSPSCRREAAKSAVLPASGPECRRGREASDQFHPLIALRTLTVPRCHCRPRAARANLSSIPCLGIRGKAPGPRCRRGVEGRITRLAESGRRTAAGFCGHSWEGRLGALGALVGHQATCRRRQSGAAFRPNGCHTCVRGIPATSNAALRLRHLVMVPLKTGQLRTPPSDAARAEP